MRETGIKITYNAGVSLDSCVKSQFCDDKTIFKMRKKGIKNTYDAGVSLW